VVQEDRASGATSPRRAAPLLKVIGSIVIKLDFARILAAVPL